MSNGASVIKVAGEEIEVRLLTGQLLRLRPVAMPRMASDCPHDWLKFQGAHIAGTSLSDEAMASMQMFMRSHRTEALSDGARCVTLAGGMLAMCDPSALN